MATTKKKTIPALEPTTPPNKRQPDPVEQASKESFPASDPPAHGGVAPPQTKDEKAQNPAEGIKPEKPARGPDKVRVASEESFPASDPPAWGTSHV